MQELRSGRTDNITGIFPRGKTSCTPWKVEQVISEEKLLARRWGSILSQDVGIVRSHRLTLAVTPLLQKQL